MKVPPKRKGNKTALELGDLREIALNESPSEKEGKYGANFVLGLEHWPLNESPSEKEGKWRRGVRTVR